MAAIDVIQECILRLPRKDAAMVAARAAMRVLPLLAPAPPTVGLKDRLFVRKAGGEIDDRLIFAVFRACQCAQAVALVESFDAAAVRDAAYTAARNADDTATARGYTNARAALAHHYARDADDVDRAAAVARTAVATAYANAVDAAARASYAYADIVEILDWDLSRLKQGFDLAELQLWPKSMPIGISRRWEALKQALLRLEHGYEYWIDWYEARLKGEKLVWEDIRDQILLTEEQLKQDPAAINAYLLKQARVKVLRPLNRVRVILIGPGESGKTSLLRALHGEPVVEGKEDKTVGIEIRESSFDKQANRFQIAGTESGQTITHFWDFGGQVMYHATHQFFLRSNCVYVLVLDGRRAAAGGSEADYWLEHVRAFAPGATVLMVGNKSDLGPMDWDANRLRKKYPNIRPGGFYQVASTQPENPRHDFARFRADLVQELERAGMVQQKFSEAEFSVLEELRRRSPKKTFLPKTEYENLCREKNLSTVGSEKPEEVLLDILDKLGVIIHFPKLHRLDEFLLNPRWLTYGVYQIIEHQHSRVTEGEAIDWLSHAHITDNLGNKLEFPGRRCGFILDAMEQFKVAYRLAKPGGTPTFVIPSLLPTDEPELDFPENEARAFRFRFEGLLPPQLQPQLIVARHGDIDRERVWRHGVMLRTINNGGARALLRGDAYDRTLTLWVTGLGLEAYFSVLYQDVKDILASMPELPYEELIRLPASARLEEGVIVLRGEAEPWARWKNVLHASLDGDKYYREDGVKYDLKKVLGIMAESKWKDLENELGRESRPIFQIENLEKLSMGDNITISGGQQGAVGSKAKAEGNTFQQIMQQLGNADAKQLLEELARLRKAMKEEATDLAHYQALGEIAHAEEAVQNGDGSAFLEHLKSAGHWTLDIAAKIGVPVAVKAIEQALGL